MTTMTKTDLQTSKQESTRVRPLALMKFDKEIPSINGIDKVKFLLGAEVIYTRVKDIEKCDPGSVFGALVQTAILGLDPNPDLGLVYYVPRTNRATNSVQLEFKLGYKGLKEIILRNPEITMIDTDIVYEKDSFEVEKFAIPPIKHKPNYKDRGKPVLVYAVAKFRGEYIFEVLNEADINDAKNRSDARTSQYSPWNAQEQSVRLEMWKKTAFRRLCKLLPLSVTKRVQLDDAVIPETAITQTDQTVEVNYTEIVPQNDYPEPTATEVEYTEPVEVVEAKEEAKETVKTANDAPQKMSDKTLQRIINGEVQCNFKIYPSGQFGCVYVKAKDAKYEDKGIKLYIQTAEQAAAIEELASKKEKSKAPAPAKKEDDLPF